MTKLKNSIVKINNFKYSLIISLSIMFLLSLCSLVYTDYCNFFLLLTSTIFFVSCCIFNYEKNLCILLFLISFGFVEYVNFSISYFSIIVSMFVVVFGIKYLVDVCTKKVYFLNYPLIVSIILCLYSLLNFDSSEIISAFSVIVLFAFCYLTFYNANKINKIKVIKYFLLGVTVSLFISYIILLFEGGKNIVFGIDERFQACSVNPNTLQILCVVSISLLIYLYFKRYIGLYMFYPYILFFVVNGYFTKSKAFLICFFILLVFYFILEFRNNKKVALISLGFCSVFAFLVAYFFKDELMEYLNRFTSYGYDNILDKILTGRFTIWKSYLGYWASSAITIIFGCGVTHAQPFELGAHSGYVDAIFTYGILGCIILIALIFAYAKEVKYKKQRFKFVNCLPLLLLLIIAFEESIFFSIKYFFVFALSFLILFDFNNKIY